MERGRHPGSQWIQEVNSSGDATCKIKRYKKEHNGDDGSGTKKGE